MALKRLSRKDKFIHAGALWRMNSIGGQKDNLSDKISLIYFNQIEAFRVNVRRGWSRKTHNFYLSWKEIQNALLSCLCFFKLFIT